MTDLNSQIVPEARSNFLNQVNPTEVSSYINFNMGLKHNKNFLTCVILYINFSTAYKMQNVKLSMDFFN